MTDPVTKKYAYNARSWRVVADVEQGALRGSGRADGLALRHALITFSKLPILDIARRTVCDSGVSRNGGAAVTRPIRTPLEGEYPGFEGGFLGVLQRSRQSMRLPRQWSKSNRIDGKLSLRQPRSCEDARKAVSVNGFALRIKFLGVQWVEGDRKEICSIKKRCDCVVFRFVLSVGRIQKYRCLEDLCDFWRMGSWRPR